MNKPNDTGPQTPPGSQTLEAGEFVLRDAAGRVGARLDIGPTGPRLLLFDASGTTRVRHLVSRKTGRPSHSATLLVKRALFYLSRMTSRPSVSPTPAVNRAWALLSRMTCQPSLLTPAANRARGYLSRMRDRALSSAAPPGPPSSSRLLTPGTLQLDGNPNAPLRVFISSTTRAP